ncbi:right-handed parallel beta-helix repeat-containing protein [Planctomycetota bacterium]
MKKLLVLIFFFCCASLWAKTLYVPSAECPDIQSAIIAADEQDTIIVSEGTYQENIDFLWKAITLRSTDPNDPNVVAATIIDANNPSDPNYGSAVTFRSGESNESIIEGFTITGGTGSWILVSWEFKGLRWNRCGGGVLCYNMSEPTIRKNVFINNIAGQGGGIYIYGNPVNPANPENPPVHISPVITDNTFINNSAIVEHGFEPPDTNYICNDHGDGGGIVAFQGVDPIIKNNFIYDNIADMYGGGLHLRQWSDGITENNQVIYNNSLIGPGIHITYSSSPEIIDNLIQDNYGGSGAALYVYYLSEPYIARNRITGNSANNGIIGVHYSSAGEIKNNIIDNNINGPAIICTSSSPLISHNTIINNEEEGIICNGTSAPQIANNIIALSYSGYGIDAGVDANPTIIYNDVWNNANGNYGPGIPNLTGTQGNISVDPDFLSGPDGKGHLNYDSPCIEAGDPGFVPDSGEVDFDGQPRILNSQTDIGADEVPPVWNLTNKEQYLSIQSAIDDANNGDTILAVENTYFENLLLNGRAINLRSLKPYDWDCIEKTIIDGNDTSSPVITFSGTEDGNCIITGFTITGAANDGSGGAIAGNGTRARISFCNIENNTAYEGAGIYNCDGLIMNCKISQNTCQTYGAGLNHCDGIIYNCFITENHSALAAGGLYDCYADVINTTIAGNSADVNAGGLHWVYGQIINSIIWANAAPQNPGLYQCSQPIFSCLQTTIPGEGNIYCNPQFVDPNDADYHLRLYSDCIDVADNNSLPTEFNLDIDREQRPFTFEANENPRLDIGADEVITSPADFNENGTVDYFDFTVFANDWLQYGEDLPADFTSDGFINFNDYAFFAEDWGFDAPWGTDNRESALQFDSDSGGYAWIHTPEGCVLNNVFTFTYTAWIYPLQFNATSDRIIGKNERAFQIGIGGTLKGYSHGGGIPYSVSDIGTIKTGEWQFVAMTYDFYSGDQLIHLYANGKEVNYQVQIIGEIFRPPLPDWRTEGEWDLVIGSKAWDPGTYIPNTIIDEVVIYNRVLAQQELEYLYNYGYGRPTPEALNPIGLWHFDENQGTTVQDSSGNNNHGLLQGDSPPVWTNGRFLKY